MTIKKKIKFVQMKIANKYKWARIKIIKRMRQYNKKKKKKILF